MIKNSLLLLLIVSINLHAQQFASKIRPIELSMQLYACNFLFKGDPYADFKSEFPNSQILSGNVDVTGRSGVIYGSSTSTKYSFAIGIPVKIFKSSTFKNTLRFGYDGLGGINLGGQNYEEKRVRLDSTFYPQYNTSLMKDSVYVDRKGAVISGKVHQVKADLLFRFRPEKRFTIYSGVGLGLALTSSRNVEISHEKWNFTEVTSYSGDTLQSPGFNPNSSNDYSPYPEENQIEEVAQETYKVKTAYSLYSYIPFGLDWKLSKKENILGKFHVYIEGQLGARFSDVYLNTKQTTFYASSQVGLRVTL